MSARDVRERWAEPLAELLAKTIAASQFIPPSKEAIMKAIADMIEAVEDHHLECWHGDDT